MTEDFDPFVEIEKEETEAIEKVPVAPEKEKTPKEDPALKEALDHLKTCLDSLTDVIKSLDRWQRYDMDKALIFFKQHRGVRYWP